MANADKRPLKVFLCHASGDKPPVRDLYKRLTAEGVDAWLDKEKLLPGQDWRMEIPRAVGEADVVVVCLSKKSITKEGYVQKEIKFALDIAEEKPDGTIFLIPARLEDCVVPERLSRWHWVDLYEDDGFIKLLRSLKLRADAVNAAVEPTSYIDSEKETDHKLEQLYTEGLAAFYTEDWDKACQRFQSILSERPNHKHASQKLEEAERQRNLSKLYVQSSEAVRSEDWDTAIHTLEELSYKSADYKDAGQLLKKARKQKQLKELYAEAKALHVGQQWEAVVKVFEQISSIDPNYPDTEELLPSTQKEVAALERLADLNDQYSHALREMDAGNWYEARRFLEAVHKSQTGFLETEKLLRKVENEIVQEEKKRKQNDQINTLYEQAHGLLRSKKWRNALDKMGEIRKLDEGFSDTDGIAEKAKKEQAREEQEAERQNKLAALYAEAVKLLKEEKYQEALDKWQDVRAIDQKYPDRQWVQRTARNALTKSTKPTSLKSRFAIPKSLWIGLSVIGVVVISIFGINLFDNDEKEETFPPTSTPAKIVVNYTNASVPTVTPSPTLTSTLRPATPVPATIGYSDVMYDNFDSTAFDGGYNTNLWRVHTWMISVESANYVIRQEKGKLAMTIYDDAGLSLVKRYPTIITETTFFEARLYLDPNTTNKEGGLFIQAVTDNGYALCGVFRTGDYAQQIKCYSEFYGIRTETKLGLDGLLPSWHMLRFEIDPETMVVDYIVDGQQVASFNPSDSIPDFFDDFKSSGFTFVIALDNYGYSKAPVGYIDFARMGNAKDDPLIFFDDFNGPVLDEIYKALPEYLLPNYKGVPDFSFELLDRSTVLRLRNNLQPEQSVGWQTATIFPVETIPIRFEVRFNTMVQSRISSIDGFLTVGLIDGGNKRYNKVDLFAGNYGKDRTFAGKPFEIKDKTWYRLVLTGSDGQEITAALYDDETGKTLIETGLGYNADLFKYGVKIGLAQFMGTPNGSYLTDVAIDWIRLAFIPTP